MYCSVLFTVNNGENEVEENKVEEVETEADSLCINTGFTIKVCLCYTHSECTHYLPCVL